jgi:hypothetical protein
MGCQVDGFLALITTSTTRIIVEVKPRPRHACELVAAILSGRQRLAQGQVNLSAYPVYYQTVFVKCKMLMLI